MGVVNDIMETGQNISSEPVRAFKSLQGPSMKSDQAGPELRDPGGELKFMRRESQVMYS